MSETVSKTKGAIGAAVQEATTGGVSTGSADAPRKTVTNWRVLANGGFTPVMVRCEGYKNNHPADMSCRTTIIPNVGNVLRHMSSDHGGGWFKIKFRISDSKKEHELWRALEDAGVELQDFYCPHCRQDVAMIPRQIVKHLQAHAGATRVNTEPQVLCMTLGFNKPEDELEGLYVE